MEIKNKQELKSKILRLLGVDARISMQDLANSLKTTKVNAYNLFNEVTSEYGIHFVPEINIDKLWKWEFIKRARLRTKRGILAEAVEELPLTGFGEYIIFLKFVGKKPSDEEIVKAMGNAYVPQFVAKLKGDYSIMIYAVARSYEEAAQFTDTLNKNLAKYSVLSYTNRVWGNFGFFPLNKKLMEQFDIFDTYKNLLFGLSDMGRSTFTDIGKRFNQGPAQMLYAYDRLARTEILRRVTYFEEKPKNGATLVAIFDVENVKEFEETRSKWFMKLLKEYEKRENECVFMCDISNPKGVVVIASFGSAKNAGRFFSGAKSSLKGVKVRKMQLAKVLTGSLGIRDFDMRYTTQHKILERNRLVPAVQEKPVEQPVENPNAI